MEKRMNFTRFVSMLLVVLAVSLAGCQSDGTNGASSSGSTSSSGGY
jgi:hypothetical protein